MIIFFLLTILILKGLNRIYVLFKITWINFLVNANSRTCDVQTEFDTCSSNSQCGCLPLSNSNSLGVCGLRNASCSDFVECQSSDDTCAQPEHVCIRPPRCGSPRLCYPLAMAQQNLCPPLISKYLSNNRIICI